MVDVASKAEERKSSKMDGLVAILAFGIFAVLWVAFAIALVASQGSLDAAWAWLRGLPMIVQVPVGLLLLPVVAGLWVWESAWPLAARLVLVAGIAVANLYVFLPRSLFGGRG